MNRVKAFLGGSGKDLFGERAAVERLLQLTGRFEGGRLTKAVSVVYIGTATYDLPQPMRDQTGVLTSLGCSIFPICVADPSATLGADERTALEKADIVLGSGGNTLYAVRRWEESGLAALLKERLADTAKAPLILAGGSAGAIIWFTSGHSDSADPSTYVMPMLKAAQKGEPVPPSSGWSYIRVHGLALLPGMVCPHYDRAQSGNDVVRRDDFVKMLKRHPTERGIGIDHYAALVLLGNGRYEVFVAPGKVKEDGQPPGVHTLDVVNGAVQETTVPSTGSVDTLLREPTNGVVIRDPFEMFCAMENPTPSSGELVRR